MSNKLTFAAALLGATVLAGAAHAQTADFVPLKAGTILAHVSVIDVIGENNSSWTALGGQIKATSQLTPEVDASYFLTNNVAVNLIAATTSHLLSLHGSALTAGKYDLGSTSVLPPTLTVQYHFLPASRFSPYVGAGLNYTFFYNTEPANNVVKHLSLTNNFGYALNVGFNYAVSGPWVINADVKQIFLHTTASVDNGLVHAKTNLDPLVIGVGVGYKF